MMDGYRGPSILIATTNYETPLDKAVWRRFDEVIRFEPLNLEQAKRLLALAFRRAPELRDGRLEDRRALQGTVPRGHRARPSPRRQRHGPVQP